MLRLRAIALVARVIVLSAVAPKEFEIKRKNLRHWQWQIHTFLRFINQAHLLLRGQSWILEFLGEDEELGSGSLFLRRSL